MSNPYTEMQKRYYEHEAPAMNVDNHMFHNKNPDYWDILVKDTETGFEDKLGLDFGCGCGRNVMNLWKRFKRMDGCDISHNNVVYALDNVIKNKCSYWPKFFVTNGLGLNGIPDNEYDFVMSTIVLQHICVYDIRLSILKDIFRVMKPGGLFSFQMGFGTGQREGGRQTAGYYENALAATGTNSDHDVQVTDPNQLLHDLDELIGFVDFQHWIRPSFSDNHPNWIFVKVRKPL